MKITFETKKPFEMRYCTAGDYYYDEQGLHIESIETGDDDMNFCILLHELIEEKLTRKDGIKEGDILKFDLWVESQVNKGHYPNDTEPGEHKLSPYKSQHRFAEKIENLLIKKLKINKRQYQNKINDLLQ